MMSAPWHTITVDRAGATYTVEYHIDCDAENPREAFGNTAFLATWRSRHLTFDTDPGTHNAAVTALRHVIDRYGHTDIDHVLRAFALWRTVSASPDRLFYGTYDTLSYYAIAATAETAHGEARMFGQWAAGEVYGYHLIDPDGSVIDDCWGFYDTDAMREIWSQSLRGHWYDRARTAAIHRRELRRQARSAGAGLIGVI